jgi:hypothetical protein
MLSHFNGPHRGLFANDDLTGEMNGILLYVILPLVVGILLARLCIYIWMSWRGSKWSNASPTAVATMIGTLLLLTVPVIIGIWGHRVDSIHSAAVALISGIVLTVPILAVVGTLLLIYAGRLIQEVRPISRSVVYSLCAASVVAEYFYLREFLSH